MCSFLFTSCVLHCSHGLVSKVWMLERSVLDAPGLGIHVWYIPSPNIPKAAVVAHNSQGYPFSRALCT